MAINLREKIQKITLHPIFKMDKAFSDITLSGIDADAILSIVREAVKERKPLTAKPIRKGQKITKLNEGYNEGVSDYHSALMEVLK